MFGVWKKQNKNTRSKQAHPFHSSSKPTPQPTIARKQRKQSAHMTEDGDPVVWREAVGPVPRQTPLPAPLGTAGRQFQNPPKHEGSVDPGFLKHQQLVDRPLRHRRERSSAPTRNEPELPETHAPVPQHLSLHGPAVKVPFPPHGISTSTQRSTEKQGSTS